MSQKRRFWLWKNSEAEIGIVTAATGLLAARGDLGVRGSHTFAKSAKGWVTGTRNCPTQANTGLEWATRLGSRLQTDASDVHQIERTRSLSIRCLICRLVRIPAEAHHRSAILCFALKGGMQ